MVKREKEEINCRNKNQRRRREIGEALEGIHSTRSFFHCSYLLFNILRGKAKITKGQMVRELSLSSHTLSQI